MRTRFVTHYSVWRYRDARAMASLPAPPSSAAQEELPGARRVSGRAPKRHRRRSTGYAQGVWCIIKLAVCCTVSGSPLEATALQVERVLDPFAGPSLSLTRIVTLRGSAVGQPQLTAPRAVLADSNDILVLDPPIAGVHRFDRMGNWLSTIGEEGDGPGEFRHPTEMGWLSDTLWVSDPRLGRISFFDKHKGAFVRSLHFRFSSNQSVTVPRRMFGRLALGVPQLESRAAMDLDSIPILLFNHDGTLRDTLAWRTIGGETVSVSIKMNSERNSSGHGTLTVSHPFDSGALFAADPQGRWIYTGTWRLGTDGTSYFELLQVTETADTAAVRELPFPRLPVSRRDVERYADQVYGRLPETIRSRLSAREFREHMHREVTRPTQSTIDAMIVGDEETVWFRRTPKSRNATSFTWVAYRLGRGFLGVIASPEGHEFLGEAGGMLWMTSEDGLGLPIVTGWEVSWPPPLER